MTTVSSDKINFISLSKDKSRQSIEVGSLNQYRFEILDGEGVTKATFEFLTKINQQEVEGQPEALLEGMEVVEDQMIDHEIALEDLHTFLKEQGIEIEEKELYQKSELPKAEVTEQNTRQKNRSSFSQVEQKKREPSLQKESHFMAQRAAFSQKMHSPETQKAPFFMVAPKKSEGEREKVRERSLPSSTSIPTVQKESSSSLHEKKKRETIVEKSSLFSLCSETRFQNQEGRREREGSGQQQREKGEEEKNKEGSGQQQKEREQEKEQEKREKKGKVLGISRKYSASVQDIEEEKEQPPSILPIGDIFTSFIALMARILGQAQAEAHMLYQKIKERTDNVDILTTLLSKLNNQNKKVDWTKDPEMRALVDKARALGVEIPEGKYSWSEEEKRHLKENIQMRKDTLEKITQLERTDMQRFMQEVSQCHQARSNVLKMIKEIADTIIANLRGH